MLLTSVYVTHLCLLVRRHNLQFLESLAYRLRTIERITVDRRAEDQALLFRIPALMYDLHLFHDRSLARLAGSQQEDLTFLLEPASVLLQLSIYRRGLFLFFGGFLLLSRETGAHARSRSPRLRVSPDTPHDGQGSRAEHGRRLLGSMVRGLEVRVDMMV